MLGVVAGIIWAAVAPRALIQEVGRGEAQLVNAESNAFILADLWFCLIVVLGGTVTGIAGYRLLVRRAGWTAAAGLLLAASASGTFFHASLALGAKSALALWPGLTSLIVLLAEYGGRAPSERALSVD